MKKHVLMAMSLAFGCLGLVQGQAQATACSQLGHWYWPPEFSAIEFAGSIGNHEGVKVKYYTDLKDNSNVVQVSRMGYVDTKTYEYRSNSSALKVSTVGSVNESYTVANNDGRYVSILMNMRDLIGYAGAPESYFRPDGGPESVNPGAIHMVKFFDGLIAKQNQAPTPANCVLYTAASQPLQSNACQLTGGPVFTLGAWNDQVRAVWVRAGYRLTLINDENFSKSGGLVSYDGLDSSAQELDGGRLITVEDEAALAASSALCVRTQL